MGTSFKQLITLKSDSCSEDTSKSTAEQLKMKRISYQSCSKYSGNVWVRKCLRALQEHQ